MRLPIKQGYFCLALGFAAASCSTFSASERSETVDNLGAARSIPTGPQADYPMVLGDPFTIDGMTYTPSDTLNYDEVGYASADDAGASGITVGHRTLPLPSYVEITELTSGRTILARVERRGPMVNSRLIALAPAAMRLLGAVEGAPVRVRRVNPPEEQRADLRAGNEAAARMDTPEGLLTVLRRRLPETGSAPTSGRAVSDATPITKVDPDTGQDRASTSRDAVATEPAPIATVPEPGPVAAPAPGATSAPVAAGDWVVQAGAFSVKSSADRVAAEIGGYVEPAGRLWRVRSGPYQTRGQAEAALAKVRGTGYSGAQVYSTR